MGLSIMYISILNWQFFPYFSWKRLNFHIRFVMPNVSVTNRVFKDIYYLFPYSPALDEKSPTAERTRGKYASAFYIYVSPLHQSSAFFKTFTSFVKYFHGWGVEGGSCFQKFQLYSVSAFSGSDRCSILFCEIGIFQKSRCIVLLEFTLMVTRV